jgi:hypothetical protein
MTCEKRTLLLVQHVRIDEGTRALPLLRPNRIAINRNKPSLRCVCCKWLTIYFLFIIFLTTIEILFLFRYVCVRINRAFQLFCNAQWYAKHNAIIDRIICTMSTSVVQWSHILATTRAIVSSNPA